MILFAAGIKSLKLHYFSFSLFCLTEVSVSVFFDVFFSGVCGGLVTGKNIGSKSHFYLKFAYLKCF